MPNARQLTSADPGRYQRARGPAGRRPGRRFGRRSAGVALGASLALAAATLVAASPASATATSRQGVRGAASRVCPPAAAALTFSDALDKKVVDGATVGGLSDIAYDRRSRSYVSSVDNHGSDPSRLWFYRDLAAPRLTRDPLVLKAPDGTPYTGHAADNEGLAVLPDGEYLVSSETEPSIRVFGRDGVQRLS